MDNFWLDNQSQKGLVSGRASYFAKSNEEFRSLWRPLGHEHVMSYAMST
jgi:hypothetical protein